jgi:BolA protein
MTKDDITQKLTHHFSPDFIQVIDDSDNHRGHRGTHHTKHTHFNITIISHVFIGMSLIQRHRTIHALLKTAFDGPLHALKIIAKTPHEWTP